MRECAQAGEGQRERGNPKQVPHCQHRAKCRAQTHEPQDHALSQNQQSDTQLIKPPRHPYLTFEEPHILFSRVAAPVCIPVSSVRGFPFLCILTNTYHFLCYWFYPFWLHEVISVCVCVCVCVCTDEYYAKWNKSVRERQIPYDFSHMWNLGNKTNEHRGKKKRRKPRNRPLTIENKLMVT